MNSPLVGHPGGVCTYSGAHLGGVLPPTGAGKTYTMLGMDTEPGIYLRTLADLFQAIEEACDSMDYRVSMSYLEVSLPILLSCPVCKMDRS